MLLIVVERGEEVYMERIPWDAENTLDAELTQNEFFGVAFCVAQEQIHALLMNVQGELVESVELDGGEDEIIPLVLEYMDKVVKERKIMAIGIGMPGVVVHSGFRKMPCAGSGWYDLNIKTVLSERYHIPVVLENDLNATAIGIGLGYGRGVSYKNFKDVNMAYLYFNDCSINAGLIAGGEVIRGCNNYAGELGLLPMGHNKLVYEFLSDPMDDKAYVKFVFNIIIWICALLNPQYVALGGPSLRRNCIGMIADELHACLAPKLFAEIVCSHDEWHDYHEGMAYLTAKKMSEEVRHMGLVN